MNVCHVKTCTDGTSRISPGDLGLPTGLPAIDLAGWHTCPVFQEGRWQPPTPCGLLLIKSDNYQDSLPTTSDSQVAETDVSSAAIGIVLSLQLTVSKQECLLFK